MWITVRTLNVEKRSNGQAIYQRYARERYLRASFSPRGPGRPTIQVYTVKQQHMSAAEKKPKETL